MTSVLRSNAEESLAIAQTAWTRLLIYAESATLVDVLQFFTTQYLEIAANPIALGHLDSVEHSMGPRRALPDGPLRSQRPVPFSLRAIPCTSGRRIVRAT